MIAARATSSARRQRHRQRGDPRRGLPRPGQGWLPEDATTLARIMTIDKLEDCRIAAIEAIGSLKTQRAADLQILLDGMDHDDPAIRYQCLQSLRTITEKDYGIDPAAWKRELEPMLAEKPARPIPRQRWRRRTKAATRPLRARDEGGIAREPASSATPSLSATSGLHGSRWLGAARAVR